LAGALAAAKLHIPIGHVEAGLRSFNRRMPEEINRVLTDHASTALFCPTPSAACNLKLEGITEGVQVVGDVMYDALTNSIQRAQRGSSVMERLCLLPGNYVLVTIHRAENTDCPGALTNICSALQELAAAGERIVFPAHPRTVQRLDKIGIKQRVQSFLIEPVSYLDMLLLEKNSKVVMTDSGGVQKEAFWFSVPCITLRDETEWMETVQAGWNTLAGSDKQSILSAFQSLCPRAPVNFGDAGASERIVGLLCGAPVTQPSAPYALAAAQANP
jgi:UDP-N-acetylglucosamine 2-epimerase